MMRRIKLLIGDDDSSYVEALVRYLIASGQRFEIRSHTQIGLMTPGGEYDIGLLTEPFIKRIEDYGDAAPRIGKVFFLSGVGESLEGYETLYKYQSMDRFMEQLLSAVTIVRAPAGIGKNRDIRRIAVMSSVHHELLMPYTISVCRILGERSPTLLVDMQQVSNLPQLLGRTDGRDLTDLLYLLSSGAPLQGIPAEYMGFYENFSYLPPVRSSFDEGNITYEEFEKLVELLYSCDYANLIFTFDSIVSDMTKYLYEMDEVFLLTKSGAYFEGMTALWRRMFEEAEMESKVREILLPSASITGGGIGVTETLLAGAVGNAIRRGLANEKRA